MKLHRRIRYIRFLCLGMPAFLIFGFASPAFSVDGCTLKYSVEPSHINRSEESLTFLDEVLSSFGNPEQEIASEYINFFLPRLPYAQDRFDDLIFTLEYLVEGGGIENQQEIMFTVIQDFSTGVPKPRIPISQQFGRASIYDLILGDIEKYKPLLDYHVERYNYLRWYHICQGSSPYVFFYGIAYEAARVEFSNLDDPAAKDYIEKEFNLEFERLYYFDNDFPYQRYYYLVSSNEIILRAFVSNCFNREAGPIKIVDLSYDIQEGIWKEIDLNQRFVNHENVTQLLEAGRWFTGGFSDYWVKFPDGLVPIDRRDFLALQEENIKRFLEEARELAPSIEMPTEEDFRC